MCPRNAVASFERRAVLGWSPYTEGVDGRSKDDVGGVAMYATSTCVFFSRYPQQHEKLASSSIVTCPLRHCILHDITVFRTSLHTCKLPPEVHTYVGTPDEPLPPALACIRIRSSSEEAEIPTAWHADGEIRAEI